MSLTAETLPAPVAGSDHPIPDPEALLAAVRQHLVESGDPKSARAAVVRHLLAVKVWRVDMTQRIVETMPMRAFRRGSVSRTRRAQA